MAITFTNSHTFTATNCYSIFNSLDVASFLWWFRYEPSGSQQGSQIQCEILGRENESGFFVILGGNASAGYVNVEVGMQTTSGYAAYTAKLAVGVSYPMLMVHSQGSQTLYLPGQMFPVGTLTGTTIVGYWKLIVGGAPPGSPCIYTLGDVNVWDGYACTAADYSAIVTGSDPSTIGNNATGRYRWSLAGTAGATPTIGDSGLAEAYAGVYNLDSVKGNGSAVYTAPLIYQPSAQITSQTRVGTSGQTVFFFFEAVSTGAPADPIAINATPTLYQNGVNLGQLISPFIDSSRPFIQYNVPAGVQLNPGDVVTVSAPSMWCTTTAGAVGSLDGTNIRNMSGMSAFGTESLNKTLPMGLNFSWLGTSYYCLYRLQRNQRWNLSAFSNATSGPDGAPLSFTGTSADTPLEDFTWQNNQLDSTNYPGQTGLRAIGWNAPPGSATTFSLKTYESTTIITERTDLANPGDANGNGRVRVFDIQLSANSTRACLQLYLSWHGTPGATDFTDLKIYASGDFTAVSGHPVVLDETNPYALSAVTLDRLHTGLGSARFADTTLNYSADSNAFEPWHLRNITDFSCGDWVISTKDDITFTEARPYSPSTSPYVYGPSWLLPAGSPFTATLATAIDSQTTTLTISDAETAPIISGLTLSIDSELMTVKEVSGTTVTVARGSGNTMTAAHNAGSIQIHNRLAITSLSQIGRSSDQVVELVCSAPHDLVSGMPCINFNGTWPTFSFTDGSTANIANTVGPVLVTGPTTLVTKEGWLAHITDGPVTLSQSYTLSGASTQLTLPDTGYPFEFTAMVSGQFADCWHHVNLPICGSDSYMYEVARRIRDNFPAGRKVLVELSDEPWNWGQHQTYSFYWLNQLSFPTGDQWSWLVTRTVQMTQIFINVFNQVGRGAEVIGLLNSMCAVPGVTQELLAVVQSQGITVPLWIALGPYFDPDNTANVTAAYNAANTAQGIDFLIHDLYHSSTSYTTKIQQHQSHIAAFNAATGSNCQLYAYECGIETCVPSGCNYQMQRTRDAVYHPNWWIIEQDYYAWLQSLGFVRASISAYDMGYAGANNWGVYHGPSQPYGRGDGSDGKANNLHCLAMPGQTYTKSATVNQDLQNVSVRGSAFLNWMAGTSRSFSVENTCDNLRDFLPPWNQQLYKD